MTDLIEKLEYFLADRGIYMLALILFAIGVYGMIACGNYLKKLMCMNMMQVGIIFFFLTFGQKEGATLPIAMGEISSADMYINPLPHALMLTAIVVSLGTGSGSCAADENKRHLRNHRGKGNHGKGRKA